MQCLPRDIVRKILTYLLTPHDVAQFTRGDHRWVLPLLFRDYPCTLTVTRTWLTPGVNFKVCRCEMMLGRRVQMSFYEIEVTRTSLYTRYYHLDVGHFGNICMDMNNYLSKREVETILNLLGPISYRVGMIFDRLRPRLNDWREENHDHNYGPIDRSILMNLLFGSNIICDLTSYGDYYAGLTSRMRAVVHAQ